MVDMSYDYFSKNGQLLPADQAVVPLDDIAYAYGFGVYETIRVAGGTVYFAQQHAARLLASAAAIELEHRFSAAAVEQAISDLVEKNQAEACNVKVLLVGGPTAEAAQLYIQCLNPLFPDRQLYKDGATFITERYQREYPHAKTLNMLPSYLAYRRAAAAGAYDALLIDRGGNITEGTRTNFFGLQGRTLVSPPEANILLGVMRMVVFRVAAGNGFSVEERHIKPQDLPGYEAAFVTSTSSKVMPVRAIDTYEFGPQPATLTELMKLTDDFLENCHGILE